jgi:phage shock protein PspC (stress-responsive transcriptional regulator)
MKQLTKSDMKLAKSEDDKVVAGVCGGIGEYFGVSSTLIRLAFVVCFFLGFGSPFLVYVLLALFMPKQSFYEE